MDNKSALSPISKAQAILRLGRIFMQFFDDNVVVFCLTTA